MNHPFDPGPKPTEFIQHWIEITDEIFTKETINSFSEKDDMILSFVNFHKSVVDFCNKNKIFQKDIRLRIDNNNYEPIFILEQMTLIPNVNFKYKLKTWENKKIIYDKEIILYNIYLKEMKEKEKIKKIVDILQQELQELE